jgi:Myb-like DNA-binding protein
MPRQTHQPWKPEDDETLRQMVEARKSWVLISAKLKRSVEHVQYRHRLLLRQSAIRLRSD